MTLLLAAPLLADTIQPTLPTSGNQPWTGADIWANPMEDWQTVVKKGKPYAQNILPGGDRELVILTAEINDKAEALEMSASFEPVEAPASDSQGFIGFQLGLRGEFNDYRDSAIYGSGLSCGVRADGRLFIGNFASDKPLLKNLNQSIDLKLTATPTTDGLFTVTVKANEAEFKKDGIDASWFSGLASFTISSMPPNNVKIEKPRPGRVSRIKQGRNGTWKVGISDMSLTGNKITHHPERSFGPILWAQHTLESSGKLNLIAQMAPVGTSHAEVSLTIDGKKTVSKIHPQSRVATFRLEGINTTKSHNYEINWQGHSYTGTIRQEPVEKENLTVAALSCNDAVGFPHNPLVENVKAHAPDVLFFMGDQIYENIGGYGLVYGSNNTTYNDRAFLSYLRKYAMHAWSWRDIMRNTPAFAIPDDHDVFHGNFWGAGGKLANRRKSGVAAVQDSGGYKMPVDFVNAVHQTTTASLPEPADPKPTPLGITVYFTDWQYGGIDMAVVADRQFKSAPKALLPEAKIYNGWPKNKAKQHPNIANPKELDHPKAELLGKRQEEFLKNWASSNDEKNQWRLVISATPLTTLQTIPEKAFSDNIVPKLKALKPGEYAENDIPKIDFDSNGWPQSKRDIAVDLITKAGAVHVTGDQHLGSTGQYGTVKHQDSAWWITSPATANRWPRRWFPKNEGQNRRPNDPKYTGDFEDGFANKITVHAASNPRNIGREPARLFNKAVGYSILTLHRNNGHITLANWPYYASPTQKQDNQPYQGWPITIDPKTNQRIK